MDEDIVESVFGLIILIVIILMIFKFLGWGDWSHHYIPPPADDYQFHSIF